MKYTHYCILIGALAASLSLPAHAAWESVYTTGKTFGAGYGGKKSNCDQDQSTGPTAVRNTPGARLVLGGGSSRLCRT